MIDDILKTHNKHLDNFPNQATLLNHNMCKFQSTNIYKQLSGTKTKYVDVRHSNKFDKKVLNLNKCSPLIKVDCFENNNKPSSELLSSNAISTNDNYLDKRSDIQSKLYQINDLMQVKPFDYDEFLESMIVYVDAHLKDIYFNEMNSLSNKISIFMHEHIKKSYKRVSEAIICSTKYVISNNMQNVLKNIDDFQCQIMSMQERMQNYELALAHKDCIIKELITQLKHEKEQTHNKLSEFSKFKEIYCSEFSKKYYRRKLFSRVFSSWKKCTSQTSKERMQLQLQNQAQSEYVKLIEEYEKKVAELKNTVQKHESFTKCMQLSRQQDQNALKSAIMRGVCALNIETISAIESKKSDYNFSKYFDLNDRTPWLHNECINSPDKGIKKTCSNFNEVPVVSTDFDSWPRSVPLINSSVDLVEANLKNNCKPKTVETSEVFNISHNKSQKNFEISEIKGISVNQNSCYSDELDFGLFAEPLRNYNGFATAICTEEQIKNAGRHPTSNQNSTETAPSETVNYASKFDACSLLVHAHTVEQGIPAGPSTHSSSITANVLIQRHYPFR